MKEDTMKIDSRRQAEFAANLAANRQHIATVIDDIAKCPNGAVSRSYSAAYADGYFAIEGFVPFWKADQFNEWAVTSTHAAHVVFADGVIAKTICNCTSSACTREHYRDLEPGEVGTALQRVHRSEYRWLRFNGLGNSLAQSTIVEVKRALGCIPIN
jgi:hypothetical protein